MTDVSRVYAKNGKTLYYITNVSEAPLCDHGLPAVVMIGVNGKGQIYGLFVCAKNRGESWRERCEFRTLAPRPEVEAVAA